MANLLWQQRQQQAQKQLDDQAKADAYKMLAISKMDPQTMLGYKLGQYIGNYLDRGQERAATHALDPSNYDALASKNGGVSTNLMDGLTPETGAQASNLLAGLGTQGAAPVTAAATATPSAWEKLAAQNGDVSNGGLLGGISGGTTGDAAKAAGGAGNDILGSIGGVGSAARLANGNGSIGDIASLAKLFGFFDPAASASQAGAASPTPANGLYVVGNDVPGMISQGNTDLANRPIVKNSDGSISTVRSMSFNVDGNEVLVPTVSKDGRIMSDQEAVENYRKTGENLGVFDSPEAATNYAKSLHNQQADMYLPKAQQQPDSSGLLAKSIANGELLPTPDLVANHNQNVLQAVKQAVNPDVSSEEYYNQVYNTLRDKGYGYDVCNRVAAQKAQAYQAQRISDLSSQFTSSGLNPNGAVNNSGAQILVKLAQESPQSYEILSRMYATPKDDYGFNKSIQQAVLNSGLQWQRDDHVFANQQKGADANVARTKDLHNFDANLNVRQKEALSQIALKTKGLEMQQRYGIMFNAAKQFGMDDNAASQYALGISNKDNSRYMDPKIKAQLEAAKAVIYDYNKHISNGGTNKDYPNMNAYNQAMATYSNIINGGGTGQQAPSQQADGMSPDMERFQKELEYEINTNGADAAREKVQKRRALLEARGINVDEVLSSWIPS